MAPSAWSRSSTRRATSARCPAPGMTRGTPPGRAGACDSSRTIPSASLTRTPEVAQSPASPGAST
eukprot:8540979-Alexandrium_andersonii.AAC.1